GDGTRNDNRLGPDLHLPAGQHERIRSGCALNGERVGAGRAAVGHRHRAGQVAEQDLVGVRAVAAIDHDAVAERGGDDDGVVAGSAQDGRVRAGVGDGVVAGGTIHDYPPDTAKVDRFGHRASPGDLVTNLDDHVRV